MLLAHLLEGEELDQAFEGEDADGDELRARRRSQYADFVRTRLLQRAPLDGAARVSIRFTCSAFHLRL